jgi:hypothetical protein
MVNIKIENLVEVECPILNDITMKKNNTNNSPGLKIQLFLNGIPAKEFAEGFAQEDSCTKILCNGYNKKEATCLYSISGARCEYSVLSTENKK